MDPAIYALIGAVLGIVITQLSNFLQERNRSKSQLDLKSLELDHEVAHYLYKERRIAYAKYLEAIDIFHAPDSNGIADCIPHLYSALIVASKETGDVIKRVFNMLKEDDKDIEEYLTAKLELLESMQNDLQKKI